MAGFPPQLPPGAQGASPAPMSPELANKGSLANGSLLQMILAFLAGAGGSSLLDKFSKMGHQGKGAKGATVKPGQPPQGQVPPGSPPQPMPPGGQQIPPELLLQLLAQRGQQPPQ